MPQNQPVASPYVKLLIATAVSQERDAVIDGLTGDNHHVHIVGVGPTAAAAATASHLAESAAAGNHYDGVISAGIAGGIADRVHIGALVVATSSVSAQLGVQLADRLQAIDELGFGSATIACEPALTTAVAGVRGTVLTRATITGTTQQAAALAAEHPHALAEAMEGFGVATAAAQHNLPFAEIRAVSNFIGERDLSKWNWKASFASLSKAAASLTNAP